MGITKATCGGEGLFSFRVTVHSEKLGQELKKPMEEQACSQVHVQVHFLSSPDPPAQVLQCTRASRFNQQLREYPHLYTQRSV